MATLFAHIRFAVGALALLVFVAIAAPVSAQQPTSVNPTASAVQEQNLLNELGKVQGRGSIPDTKSYTLEQPAGRSWRQFHEVWLRWIAGIAIVGMVVLLALFLMVKGRVRLEAGRSGRTIVRFNAFERFVHWMTATCFLLLGLTGLNITFGKVLLLPYISPEAFTALSQYGKYAHNYLSFPFTIGVVLMFLMWIAGNIPNRTDVAWVKEGGGILKRGHHPPAGRFNAGQKLIYWIVVLGGGAVAVTGYLLMFPFFTPNVGNLQLAQIVHGVVSVLFVAAMLGHIYIGTIGMEGAFEAMGTGTVDVNWAKEHHSLWAEKKLAEGQGRASEPPPRGVPAE